MHFYERANCKIPSFSSRTKEVSSRRSVCTGSRGAVSSKFQKAKFNGARTRVGMREAFFSNPSLQTKKRRYRSYPKAPLIKTLSLSRFKRGNSLFFIFPQLFSSHLVFYLLQEPFFKSFYVRSFSI